MRPPTPNARTSDRDSSCPDYATLFDDNDPGDWSDHLRRHAWFDQLERALGRPLLLGGANEKAKDKAHADCMPGEPSATRLRGMLALMNAHYDRDLARLAPGAPVPDLMQWASAAGSASYDPTLFALALANLVAAVAPALAQPAWFEGGYCWTCHRCVSLFEAQGSQHLSHVMHNW